MSSSPDDSTSLRDLPGVDTLLRQLPQLHDRWGHQQLTAALRQELNILRQCLASGEPADTSIAGIGARVETQLANADKPGLKPVFNLSGTVLHTNLGRACLPPEAVAAVAQVAAEPANLEYDLQAGDRGRREAHIEALVCEFTGAEAATAVNNNAAAVLLSLNTLALGRQVPVSRGELVEIGGSFRVPEVMQRAGCSLVEVGATNRTHLKDYTRAINPDTAVLMKVHTSNYRIEGFTQAVHERELASLAHEHQLPLIVDLGSGSLIDFAALGLPDEPTANASIANGVDLITFSGDKLLGGPQAGIIAGRRDLIARIDSNPLKRALRLDKMTLAALAAVLSLYRHPETVVQRLPTLRLLTRPLPDIQAMAQRLAPELRAVLAPDWTVSITDCHSQIGSGALPLKTLASAALCLRPVRADDAALRQLASQLRSLPRPVIGRMHQGSLLLDLRCLEDENGFLAQLPQWRGDAA